MTEISLIIKVTWSSVGRCGVIRFWWREWNHCYQTAVSPQVGGWLWSIGSSDDLEAFCLGHVICQSQNSVRVFCPVLRVCLGCYLDQIVTGFLRCILCTIIRNSPSARAVLQEYLGRRYHSWRLSGFKTLCNLGPFKSTRPRNHVREGGFDYPFLIAPFCV